MADFRFRKPTNRWIDHVLYGLVASAVVLVLQPVIAPLGTQLGRFTIDHSEGLATVSVAATLLVFTVLVAIGRRRWLGFLGLRAFFARPPIWVACIIAIAIIVIVRVVRDDSWTFPLARGTAFGHPVVVVLSATLLCLIGLGSLSIIVDSVARIVRRKRAHIGSKTGDGIQSLVEDFEKLRYWFSDDRAAIAATDALFGHVEVAQRIAGRIDPDSGPPPTIALLGPQGSGKSTIRHLCTAAIDGALRGKFDVRVVVVDAWQYETPTALISGLLGEVIGELGRLTDVVGLQGVPRQYIDTLRSHGGWMRWTASLFEPKDDPQRLLEQINVALQQLSTHLVIWVEDLERFGGIDEVGAISRLRLIDSLHHQLDALDNVSLILTDAAIERRDVAYKIARYVEYPPEPTVWDIWRVLKCFRTHCLSDSHMRGKIDPAAASVREALHGPTSEEEVATLSYILEYRPGHLPERYALAELLRNPRVLKAALRLTYDRWSRLAGEIDFDDLLMLSVIETSHPDVFGFVRRRIQAFRAEPRQGSTLSEGKQPGQGVLEELENHLQGIESKPAIAIRAILRSVFPVAHRGSKAHIRLEKPQAVALTAGTEGLGDYWMRLLRATQVPESEADQPVLQVIEEWKQSGSLGEDSKLLDLLLGGRRRGQVRRFVRRFKRSDLLRLLEAVLQRLPQQREAEWNDRHPPALVEVWGMLQDLALKKDEVHRVVENAIPTITARNLPLAAAVIYWLAGRSGGHDVQPLMEVDQSQAIVDRVRELLVKLRAPEDVDSFVEAVRGGHAWSLYWIIWGVGVVPDDERDLPPFENWPHFAEFLLEAAKVNPVVVLPQLAPLVTTGKRRDRGFDPYADDPAEGKSSLELIIEVDEETLQGLFGTGPLLELFACNPCPDHIDGEARERYEALREFAIATV